MATTGTHQGLAPPLRPQDAVVGAAVTHRRGQWTAVIQLVDWPACWILYDADRARGIRRPKRLLADDLALRTVQAPADEAGRA